jgi:hypothetical protein
LIEAARVICDSWAVSRTVAFRIEAEWVMVAAMTTTSAARTDVVPSATPTEAELTAWAALSREAQVSRYREALMHPDRGATTGDSMSDILAAERQRVAARNHG